MKKNSSLLALISQGINIGFGLFLIPIITSQFNSYYTGMWFVFFTMASFNQLLELGFLPNIARNISYVISGAKNIKKEGVPDKADNGVIDKELLSNVIQSSKLIYLFLFLVSFFIMFFAGSAYIYSLYDPAKSLGLSYDLISYFVFISASVYNLYCNHMNSSVLGFGDVDGINKINLINRVTLIILSLFLVKYGLLGVAIANVFSVMFSRFYAYFKYKKILRQFHIVLLKVSLSERIQTFKIISHNSLRVGVSQFSAFLILKFNIFIVAYFLGVSESASFSLMISIVATLSSIASVFLNIDIQNIVSLQLKNVRNELLDRMSSKIFLSLMFYIFLVFCFEFFGKNLLLYVSPNVVLPQSNILYFCYLIYFLELNHVLSSTCISTTNRIPFVRSGVFSGVAILFLSFILAPIYGFIGVLLSQFFVQLAYNNWKWPMYLSNLFEVKYKDMLFVGFKANIKKIRKVKGM